jgi:hypothetical protein
MFRVVQVHQPLAGRPSRPLFVVAGLLTALAAGGCGSGSHQAAAPSTQPTAATSTGHSATSSGSTGSSAASPAPASSSGSVCPSASSISAAMGVLYPAPQVTGNSGNAICNYSGSNNSNGNSVMITISSGVTGADIAALAKDQGGVTGDHPVSGLGSEAYFDPGQPGLSSELFVLNGSEGIEVTIVGTQEQSESAARAVISM